MQQEQSAWHNPFLWISVLSATAAIFSAACSWVSSRTNRRALRLAEQQDSKRLPSLAVYLADAFCRYTASSRVLAFSVAVSNVSETNNSIAMVELQIHYTSASRAKMIVKIPLAPERASVFDNSTLTLLSAPIRVDAHQTVSGWLIFELQNAIVAESGVDSYELLFVDAHRTTTRLQHNMIREIGDETEEATKRVHGSTR